jgi:hypothetical protein
MVAGKKPKPLDPEAANDILDRMLSEEATPKARTTKTQQLKDLSPKVEALIAKGFTWDEITKALSKAGGVSKDTLRHAVRGKPQSKKAVKEEADAGTSRSGVGVDGDGKKPTGTPGTDDPTGYVNRL